MGFGALILTGAFQCSIGINVSAQPVDLQTLVEAKSADFRALAEAKTEAAHQARVLASPGVQHPTAVGAYTVFDVPGAGGTFPEGTFPASMNSAGAITGSFYDANDVNHGFLRAADGAITIFDPPNSGGTSPTAINPAGVITGSFVDMNGVAHGFLRAADGAIAIFDVPGAAFGPSSEAIGPNGEVAGLFYDANFASHGFLRTADGNLSTFDAPGAGATTFPQGTYPLGIDARGTIAGSYIDINSNSHGFLLAKNGAFTSFDAPGGIDTLFNFYGWGKNFSVNPEGVIAGTYFQPIAGNPFGGNYQVYIRALDGRITTFDAAAYPPCCIWSWPEGINPENEVVGFYNDGYSMNHGFLRAKDGSITTFHAPGAGVGFSQGTANLAITPSGEIMGLFRDSNYVTHGFVFTPGRPNLSSASR